ncbi:hypothetical protein [Pectobacterium aquaticum]|uniref:hypothetical protein n=1 Tax=Pectobacterium aquaticum TaxID=2204145 RepID=UPI001D031114|nr:hypothetical protein [Pectobacterium aquaticum]
MAEEALSLLDAVFVHHLREITTVNAVDGFGQASERYAHTPAQALKRHARIGVQRVSADKII